MFSWGTTKLFSYNLLHNINYAYFLYDQNAHIVYIQYPQGIRSPIFVVEDIPGLFAYPSIF